MSRQVVYSRFGSKTGLVEALFVEGFERLADRAEAVAGPRGEDDHLVSLSHAYRAHALENPAVYGLMFEGSVPGFTPSEGAVAESRRSFHVMVDAATTWLATQEGDPTQGLSLAVSLWSGVHGILSLERVGHLRSDIAETEIERLVRRVLRGAKN